MSEAITLRQAREIVKMCVEQRVSAYIKGSPGIGKSAIVKQIAQELNYGIEIFEGSSLDPTDVRGVMGFDSKSQKSFFSISPLFPNMDKHRDKAGVILLIDELGSALPATKVALQPLFHPEDRRLGEHRLPDNVIPMATGNLLTDGSGATADSEAMKDRVMMLNVMNPYQDWRMDYALSRKFHPLVLSYLGEFKDSKLNTFDKRVKSNVKKDYVTHRTWERISETLTYADKVNMADSLVMSAIAGWAGDGIAFEVISYKKHFASLPDINKIFAGDNTVPKEPGVLFAMCAMLLVRIEEAAKKMGLKGAIERVLQYSKHMDAEFQGLVVNDLYNYGEEKEYKKIMLKLPIFEKEIAPRLF